MIYPDIAVHGTSRDGIITTRHIGFVFFCLFLFGLADIALAATSHVSPSWLTPGSVAAESMPVDSYQKTFIISAYYSPQVGQSKYVTGSYAGDIRLNGGGVHGADGTPVYPGMIAAPKTYAFGTKMTIPGLGTVAVHDRGGAIVPSGTRGNAHDRLDVWMGYGDEGLKKALNWGKKTVDVTVHGVDASIKESFTLQNDTPSKFLASAHEKSAPIQSLPKIEPLFSEELAYGKKGDEVKKLQTLLRELNYYTGDVSAVFDSETHKAVAEFQMKEDIVSHESEFGAGYVGQRTMRVLASRLKDTGVAHAKSDSIHSGDPFEKDLQLGDSGQEVRALQEELRRIHLLGIESTGYYGEVTAHAVLKFQQNTMLAGDETSPGAGSFGPKTRAALNNIVAARLKKDGLMQGKSTFQS